MTGTFKSSDGKPIYPKTSLEQIEGLKFDVSHVNDGYLIVIINEQQYLLPLISANGPLYMTNEESK